MLVAGLAGLNDCSPMMGDPFRHWMIAGGFSSGQLIQQTVEAYSVDIARRERMGLGRIENACSLLDCAGFPEGQGER